MYLLVQYRVAVEHKVRLGVKAFVSLGTPHYVVLLHNGDKANASERPARLHMTVAVLCLTILSEKQRDASLGNKNPRDMDPRF